VVDISPQRGATDVRSSEPLRVRFDRPMDRASVASRFHLEPATEGALRWLSDHELVYEHTPLRASSRYTVVLEPGYRDARGSVDSLRHSWSFRTEAPPLLSGASPGPGDRDVDPSSYITLSFSREMDLVTLRSAISLTPSVPFAIRQDALDSRRVVLAPESLLGSSTDYSVTVTHDARDVDGNPLSSGGLVSFTTGAFRPLRHWIGFVADGASGAGGDGVWIVDENRFPRRLAAGSLSAFSWSADGAHLLLGAPAGSWSDQALDGSAASLPIQGEWAGFLAPGLGYAFLNHGSLRILRPDGQVVDVAGDVREAAVAPGGGRLAFAVNGREGGEIDAYDVGLRARYRLQAEPAPIDGLAWSPDGFALAYRLDPGDPQRRQVRARLLKDGGAVTIATGEVGKPVWQADSRHVFFSAVGQTQPGPVAKVVRLGLGDPPPRTLTAGLAMPSAAGLEVLSLSASPDGHQLALVARTSGPPAVWLMNADGTGLSQLTQYDPGRFPYSCRSAAWTPT
jgi:hypothetical protein